MYVGLSKEYERIAIVDERMRGGDGRSLESVDGLCNGLERGRDVSSENQLDGEGERSLLSL